MAIHSNMYITVFYVHLISRKPSYASNASSFSSPLWSFSASTSSFMSCILIRTKLEYNNTPFVIYNRMVREFTSCIGTGNKFMLLGLKVKELR